MFRNSPIIRIEPDVTSLNWEWHPGAEKIGQVDVLSYEYDVPELVKKGILPKNVQIGDTFLLSPFDNKYIAIQNFEMEVMKDKANRVSEIARLLGVSDYNYEICVVEMTKKDANTNIGADCKYFNVNVDVKNKEQNKIRQSIKVKSNFKNAKIPTYSDYESACKYAEEHNLLRDTEIESLLNSRNPNTNNMLGEREVSINLSSESQSVLDIAANLSVLKNVFSLGVNYTSSFEYKKTVVMNIKYTFAM